MGDADENLEITDEDKSSLTAEESPLLNSPGQSPDYSDDEAKKKKKISKSKSKKKEIKHKKWRGPMASRKELKKNKSKKSMKSIQSSLRNLRLDASKKKFSSRSPSPSPSNPMKSKQQLGTNLSDTSPVQMRYDSESIFDETACASAQPNATKKGKDGNKLMQ